MYDFGIHLRPVLMERRLERCQNDVQLWRVARFWRQYRKARRHLWVSNSWHFFVRQQASTPSTVQSTVVVSPLHPTTREEAPKQCLVLRGGWAACGTTSGTMSKRRPAVKSSPCLETAPQDPAALVGQQLQCYRHYILHIQHSKRARSAQCNLLGSTLERQGHQQVSFSSTSRSAPGSPTWEEAPKLCLVLRIGWAACGTTSGTTSRRRPGAGTLAHGNRQHHNAERASILAKKQQHECSCTWKQ